MKKIVFFIVLFVFFPVFAADDNFTVTNPKWSQHWWLGLTAGYSDFAFTNADLENGFHAERISSQSAALRADLGYNFNSYLAMELSLMRGVKWVKYYGIVTPNDWHSVWNSLFGLTVRSTLPLGSSVGFYGQGGLGYISRHGFSVNNGINNITAIANNIILTPLFGAGFIFNVWQDLFIDWNTIYALPNNAQQQPQTWYSGLGIYYLLGSSYSHNIENINWFPENFIQLDYMNKSLFYVNAAKTVSYVPIFFTSDIFVKQGISLIYERTFFHTSKVFSLELGAATGNWTSSKLQQNFTTFTFFPEIKLWLIRCPRFDLYFTYSLAGPTVISRNHIDNEKTGTYFTFQDFLGLGTFLGSAKHWNINIQIMHFSNGNLFPDNPGVDVPLMFGLGFTW